MNQPSESPRRKLILFIAMSLDGYIAKPNDDLSFLSVVEKAGEDYGYGAFTASVDTIIMGRKTYEWVTAQVDFPHADKQSYILTRKTRPSSGNIHFYTGNLSDLVATIREKPGLNIFCDGGADVVNALLREDLLDEMIISIIPILVGNGIRLYQDNRPEQSWQLVNTKTFDTGLVQVQYQRVR